MVQPKRNHGLEVYVNADFARNWDPDKANNVNTARLRHGYIIYYAGCPITWKSSTQTEIALSTTDTEYVDISYTLRSTIPIMRLLRKIRKQGIKVITDRVPVQCKVFEDNAGAINIARSERFRPRAKHMNIKLHHFRLYINTGRITIDQIKSEEQPEDLFTKPLPNPLFKYLRHKLMGW